jgi:hypothetical protein
MNNRILTISSVACCVRSPQYRWHPANFPQHHVSVLYAPTSSLSGVSAIFQSRPPCRIRGHVVFEVSHYCRSNIACYVQDNIKTRFHIMQPRLDLLGLATFEISASIETISSMAAAMPHVASTALSIGARSTPSVSSLFTTSSW